MSDAVFEALAKAPRYPWWLQKLLDECPKRPENGIHPWLFKVARYLHRFHSPEEIYGILKARVANCGRQVEEHEITDAIRNSGDVPWDPKSTAKERRAEWCQCPVDRIKFRPEKAIEVAERVSIEINPDWLKAHSPVVTTGSTEEYLESIFGPEERVLIFNRYQSQGAILWQPGVNLTKFIRKRWVEGAWFLSNPVDGKIHWNPRLQKQSCRSQESVTSFPYAVLECDQKPKEKWFPIWLKILVQLPLPIVSIVDSAGKSAHALVRVSASTKEEWDKAKCELRPLITLGADDGALSAVRLTRLPGCFRGGRIQELLYLNPSADGTPIL